MRSHLDRRAADISAVSSRFLLRGRFETAQELRQRRLLPRRCSCRASTLSLWTLLSCSRTSEHGLPGWALLPSGQPAPYGMPARLLLREWPGNNVPERNILSLRFRETNDMPIYEHLP